VKKERVIRSREQSFLLARVTFRALVAVQLIYFFPPSTDLASFLPSVESLYGGSGGLLHAWQRAETVRLYSKNWIEFAAKVFESDDRS
jgi:hypothetical protein